MHANLKKTFVDFLLAFIGTRIMVDQPEIHVYKPRNENSGII